MIAARVLVTQSLCGPVIERRLLAKDIRSLCPMYVREVRHARRTERKQYPLYSRYMFAWIEDTQLRDVLSVRGVVDILRKAGQPRELAIVSDSIISALSYDAPDAGLEAGDSVSVVHGRWKGLSALYSHSEDERVILLFKLLGRETEIPFHRSEVSKTLMRT